MMGRPNEWRGKFALAWDDGTIEPVLFSTADAAKTFWQRNCRASGQTIEVVVRERRAEQDLWTEIDIALANAEQSAIDHGEDQPRLFYSRLRDRLRAVFLPQQQ